jgi:shikimate dehydrogenase
MPQKFLLGLIGAPIAHSAAPAMHEQAAAALGLSCRYQLIEVAGAGRDELRGLLDNARSRGFAGVNVTYPYKETVIELLDRLAPEAQTIGAVNTVVVRDGLLSGHNTDTTGFATAVAPHLGGTGAVALIGAGGVGKAIGLALTKLGIKDVRVFDSNSARADKLATELGGRGVTVVNSVEAALDGADGLVNATPVGMLPDRGMPVPESSLHDGLWVVDAVYFPLMTPLLIAAKAKGARVMTGRELAIHQAVDAFRLFTGHTPSTDVMAEAFDAVMAKRAG